MNLIPHDEIERGIDEALAYDPEKKPGLIRRLVQFFQPKPKPPTRKVKCVWCGEEAETEDMDPTHDKIHLACQIAKSALEKAKTEVERKRRGQIEIVKTAMRELEQEKQS